MTATVASSGRTLAWVALSLCLFVGLACGGDAATQTAQRGAPKVAPGPTAPPPTGAPPPAAGPPALEGAPAADGGTPRNPRPRVLARTDFGPSARDPFRSTLFDGSGTEQIDVAPAVVTRQRDVKMAQYSVADLTLIAIARGSRGAGGRALFLASDGISSTIHQGEYFCREEVLLSSVNRDYVEIEVVDEELAKTLNLEQGKRRAIYLKSE